jgi:uncharacterized protein YkwD
MPKIHCPSCHNSISAPAEAAALQCPHCQAEVKLPRSVRRPRWYRAWQKKKQGPYSWQELLTMAQEGTLLPDDMLLQEGAQQWVRAGTLKALFPRRAPVAATSSEKSSAKPPRTLRVSSWWIALAAGGVSVVLGLCLVGGYAWFGRTRPVEQLAKQESPEDPKGTEEQSSNGPTPAKKNGEIPGKDDAQQKSKQVEKKPPAGEAQNWPDLLVARLNQYRTKAGLPSVSLDPELSRGCLAHAKYLVRNLSNLGGRKTNEEDANLPGFTPEGARAAGFSLLANGEPIAVLDGWMGRLFDRVQLLSSEVRSVGVGLEPVGPQEWICVLDAVRGRGEPIVIYPAANQKDVPISFTSGPELADPDAAPGYAISVMFPPARDVIDVTLELRDDKGALVAGWPGTPQKPFKKGMQGNTAGFIPRALLRNNCTYQVKASAQIDSKPWQLAWSFTTEDDSDADGRWARKALAKVNAYRARAGLPAVALDEKLSRGCAAHARYLVINADHPALSGLKAHDEDLSLPGASEEGKKAGKSSNLGIGDYEPTDGIDAWMATLYHRIPMLEPNLKTVGFGCALGRRNLWVSVLNVIVGRDRSVDRPHPVLYPVPDQTDVPVHFPNSGEEPNPIPDSKSGRAGYPITAFFPEKEPLKNATAKLTGPGGQEVPCWFSSPEAPANPQPQLANRQGDTVCLIPKEPLEPMRTYQVHLQGNRGGKKWQKQWSFTTGEAGVSVSQATRQVLDRINRVRSQAGLGPVELDETLSRGCRLHADYLVKNAEVLGQRKASVLDEDPLLPGFTADGLRTARQSDIFSNAPVPVFQIDDLMATFTRRIHVLNPQLQRIGFGCCNDVGRGWRCVLDLSGGRGNSRVVLYPAPNQNAVPCTSTDRIEAAKSNALGFPITVTFPQQTVPRTAQAVLTDPNGKNLRTWISGPDRPIDPARQRNTIAVHPLEPLQPGLTYSVTISAILGGSEWRQTWQFTTQAKASSK